MDFKELSDTKMAHTLFSISVFHTFFLYNVMYTRAFLSSPVLFLLAIPSPTHKKKQPLPRQRSAELPTELQEENMPTPAAHLPGCYNQH